MVIDQRDGQYMNTNTESAFGRMILITMIHLNWNAAAPLPSIYLILESFLYLMVRCRYVIFHAIH
jgi:hypothetical protein